MDDFLRRFFPAWGGVGPDSATNDRSRRNGDGAGAVKPRGPSRKGTATGPPPPRNMRAFHESLWKFGKLPPGVPSPKTKTLKILGHNTTEIATTNVLVAFLAPPGVGVRSLIQRVRYGDMERTTHDVPWPVEPPQYLCDESVYTLGFAKLPFEGFRKSGLAVCSERMAVVLAYAVDSPASLEEAKKLQRELINGMQNRGQHRQDGENPRHSDPEKQQRTVVDAPEPHSPPPFPVMLLGLKADLDPSAEGNGNAEPEANLDSRLSATESDEERMRKLDGWGFAWSRNMLHAEVSARTGDGVLEALGGLVEAIDATAKADDDPEKTIDEMRRRWIPAVAHVAESIPTSDGSSMSQ